MESTNFIAQALHINAKQAMALVPYLVLSLGIFVSVIAAGFRSSRGVLRIITLATMLPFVGLLMFSLRMPTMVLFGGALSIDPMTRLVGCVIGALTLVVSLFARTYSADHENSEWLSFLLISTLGLALLPACSDFVTFFVLLETASISGYLLAASDRKRVLSLEAGLKYLLTGAFASGLLLMGIAQMYGYVGSLDYAAVNAFIESANGQVPLMVHIAGILIMVAFAYKVGLAPFHMWSPDVYQGGPTALSAYLATATKVAVFSAFAVVLYSTGLIKLQYVRQGLYGLGLISVIVGSLMALVQSQLKRMLAYSGVANAGYAVFALISGTAALGAMFSFLSLYALALIIGFAFAQEATLKEGAESHADVDIAGLDVKSSKLSVAAKALFTAAMFSLAGIPPFPGFLAKYQILVEVWSAGYVWGAAFILVGTVLGLGYYLRTLVPLFMKNAEDATGVAGPSFFGAPTFVAAIATVMLLAILFGFSRVNQWVDYVAFFAR